MSWVLIYLVIGAIVSVLTWLYYTSNWSNREIHEGHVIVYLLFNYIINIEKIGINSIFSTTNFIFVIVN